MMSSRLDARELQRKSVHRMLHLTVGEDAMNYQERNQWKALVYDKQGQDILAPLFTVGSLRSQFGVTLHRSIAAERSEVPDVPCIYFIEPTEQNIQKIIEDCRRKLYPDLYVNFTSTVPRALLERLAFGLNEIAEAQRVSSVVDRYVNFVALGPGCVSLNLERSYSTLRSVNVQDEEIEKLLDRIVNGILSTLVTLRVGVPVIRCPADDAAQLVAQKLHEKLYELLQSAPATGTADLFERAGGYQAEGRPLLCLLDRELELATLLHHTWTYETMCHDVLDMRLNKLSVIENEEDPTKAAKKTYDIDATDKFWSDYQHVIIHEQFEAVDRELQEFNKKHKTMQQSDLNQAITQLPEMQERKRSLEMHTNIAHAILRQIQKRGLDRFYVVEDQFPGTSVQSAMTSLESLINESPNATLQDKIRAILVFYQTKAQQLNDKQVNELMATLDRIGAPRASLAYLNHVHQTNRHRSQLASGGAVQQESSLPNPLMGNHALGTAGRMFGGLLNQAAEATMRNLEKILPTKRELLTTKIVSTLMENRSTKSSEDKANVENYVYIDPKMPPNARAAASSSGSRYRAPFKRAIVCMIGGGNYTEAQQMREAAQEQGKECIYTATNFVSAEQFLSELQELGQGGAT
ncbi:unnamed protein product [Amoebophrya sp. A25]|nr:unnamed protein product [Amoebophrya sp. A25]|eukprot:GSA25T00013504001.1